MYSASLDEFVKLAAQGNLVPVCRRILADFETPLSAYRKIRGEGESFLLESVEGGERLGRYSFVGCNPRVTIRQMADRVDVIEDGSVRETIHVGHEPRPDGAPCVRDGLEVVRKVMERYKPVHLPDLPVFTGGAVGFVGYELIHDVEPVVPRPPADELRTPVIYFIIADQVQLGDITMQILVALQLLKN